MRALTLTQPWAGLVASGLKLVENRPRRMIKPSDFGKPFAIHAGRQRGDLETWRRIVEIAPETALDYPGPMEFAARVQRLMAITSAVIAVATLDSQVDPLACEIDPDSDDARAALAPDQRRWFFGPVGYVLRDVRALARPVSCKGMLGFWMLPADVERQVLEQLR